MGAKAGHGWRVEAMLLLTEIGSMRKAHRARGVAAQTQRPLYQPPRLRPILDSC